LVAGQLSGSATDASAVASGAGRAVPTITFSGGGAFTVRYIPTLEDEGETFRITVTSNNPENAPCVPAVEYFDVHVYHPPTVSVVGGITTIKIRQDITLSSLSTGTWTNGNPSVVTLTGNTVTGIAPGTSEMTFTDENGCMNTIIITVLDERLIDLNIRVFLQAAMDFTAADTIMTSYLQTHPLPDGYPDANLPVDNPYKEYAGYEDVEGYYHQIGDPNGPAGVVVDWILVEIWGNVGTDPMAPGAFRYDLLERRALLLQPKGYIVDTTGRMPQFMVYEDSDVRIVVRHRNHLAVMSNAAIAFTSDQMTYDFTTGIDQAFNYLNVYGPMILNYNDHPAINNSVSCLWAGDVNFDGTLNAGDLTIFHSAYTLDTRDYHHADVTLDGVFNNIDLNFIRDNTIKNIYSPVIFFIKNP
jgi:hypothetical protein